MLGPRCELVFPAAFFQLRLRTALPSCARRSSPNPWPGGKPPLALAHSGDEGRLNQALLVMPLLVPGIGKEDLHAVETGIGNALLEHFHGVVAVNTDIVTPRSPCCAARPPGRCTSIPIKSVSGCAAAMSTRDCPMPKPFITSGPRVRRPFASSGRRNLQSEPRQPCSSARCWPSVIRPGRITKLRMRRSSTRASPPGPASNRAAAEEGHTPDRVTAPSQPIPVT